MFSCMDWQEKMENNNLTIAMENGTKNEQKRKEAKHADQLKQVRNSEEDVSSLERLKTRKLTADFCTGGR